MKTTLRCSVAIWLLLCLSASLSFAQITVYRGLDAKGNGKAETAPSQFRIDDSAHFPGELELSTFVLEHITAKPCQLGFVIRDEGTIDNMPGYTAAPSPPPAGHWSILLPAGKTKEQAKQDFSNYARSAAGQLQLAPGACRQ